MFNFFVSLTVFYILLSFISFGQFKNIEDLWATNQGMTAQKHWFGDFNGDGMDDKLAYYGNSLFKVALSRQDLDGFEDEVEWASTNILNPNARNFVVGDFNGDSFCDLAANHSNGDWNVALSNGSNHFILEHHWGNSNPRNLSFYVGDFNGDGKDDILSYKGNVNFFALLANTDGTAFLSETQWASSLVLNPNASQFLVGDFNLDGKYDLAAYHHYDGINYAGNWNVALSNGISGFQLEAGWFHFTQTSETKFFVGDFNGDGKSDILKYKGNGEWGAIFDKLGDEIWMASGQGIGYSGLFVGDFNGDGFTDRASFFQASWRGDWYIATAINNNSNTVATWVMTFYGSNPFNGELANLWNIAYRDPNKTPVVGWNTGLINGPYNGRSSNIIDKQIDAMVNAGINLIILDKTNTYSLPLPSWPEHWAYHSERKTVDTFFTVMKNRAINGKPIIKIAIAVGAEFWSSEQWIWNQWDPWESWDKQYTRQTLALRSIDSCYVEQYPDIYFKYRGKPLVLVYLVSIGNGGTNYPPGLSKPLWHSNDFYLQPVVGYHSLNPYRLWWYGRRLSDIDRNIESMTIMPGRHDYVSGGSDNYDRQGGQFYIDSWREVLKYNTKIVILCDWNNWNEEYALEGCIGSNGWKDLNNISTFDWYLKITQKYSNIFKFNILLPGTYLKQDGYTYVYKWTGICLEQYSANFKPIQEPIIKLPQNWLQNHGYWNICGIQEEQKIISANNYSSIPDEFSIHQNYPNPFNPDTEIDFTLPEQSEVSLIVYDILGREIIKLENNQLEPGYYQRIWKGIDSDGVHISSGIYFYRFLAKGESGLEYSKIMKMIFLK